MNDEGRFDRGAARYAEEGAARPALRRWLVIIGGLWVLGALLVFLLHGWLRDAIVAQAERRGLILSGCQLDLGLGSVGLDGCALAVRPDGRVFDSALSGVAISGSVQRIEVELSGLTPARARVLGANLLLVGQPQLGQLLDSGGSLPATELPLDIAASSISWQPSASDAPALLLGDVSFESASSRLAARFEVVRRAHGQLSLGPEGLEVTLGDPSRPELRLIARVLPRAQRVDVSLDLRRVPLRSLEGSWLQMTDTLRPLEVDGRVFISIPLGLTTEVPSGDLHLTLHGLQFPVPRELEGLVYQSPPKLSGKLALGRSFDHLTVSELTFLAGELAMRGDAELELKGKGLAFGARASGPLPCRAIAESAATAHADSALAALAVTFAERALTGSVDVATVLEGNSADLEHASVVTSVGIGCGITPLPLDLSLPRQLLDRLPLDVLGQLPSLAPPPAPRARPGRRRR